MQNLFINYILIQDCLRLVGQGVKTPPSHGGITGSIPVRATKKRCNLLDYNVFLLEKMEQIGHVSIETKLFNFVFVRVMVYNKNSYFMEIMCIWSESNKIHRIGANKGEYWYIRLNVGINGRQVIGENLYG